jgi:hypothetical protein
MITPGKTTNSVGYYHDAKGRKAEQHVVVHAWTRDSDGTRFFDHHKYATEAEAQTILSQLGGLS